jgi:tetratricopeptide (TPR) repeat protein
VGSDAPRGTETAPPLQCTGDTASYARTASRLLEYNKVAEALHVCEQGFRANPGDEHGALVYLYALSAAGDLTRAEEVYALSVAYTPFSPRLRLTWAQVLATAGERRRAHQMASEALDLGSGDEAVCRAVQELVHRAQLGPAKPPVSPDALEGTTSPLPRPARTASRQSRGSRRRREPSNRSRAPLRRLSALLFSLGALALGVASALVVLTHADGSAGEAACPADRAVAPEAVPPASDEIDAAEPSSAAAPAPRTRITGRASTDASVDRVPKTAPSRGDHSTVSPAGSLARQRLERALRAADRGWYKRAIVLGKRALTGMGRRIPEVAMQPLISLGARLRHGPEWVRDQAWLFLHRVAIQDDAPARAFLELGALYRSRGKVRRALWCFKQAARIAPGSTEAWQRLSEVAAGRRRWRGLARRGLHRLLALDPEPAVRAEARRLLNRLR